MGNEPKALTLLESLDTTALDFYVFKRQGNISAWTDFLRWSPPDSTPWVALIRDTNPLSYILAFSKPGGTENIIFYQLTEEEKEKLFLLTTDTATQTKKGYMSSQDKKRLDELVVNDLTTGGTTKALSAEQGKILFQSVSDGKSKVARAITDMGVTTSATSTYEDLASKIKQIKTGYGKGSIVSLPTKCRSVTHALSLEEIHSTGTDVGLLKFYRRFTLSGSEYLVDINPLSGLILYTKRGVQGLSYYNFITGYLGHYDPERNTTVSNSLSFNSVPSSNLIFTPPESLHMRDFTVLRRGDTDIHIYYDTSSVGQPPKILEFSGTNCEHTSDRNSLSILGYSYTGGYYSLDSENVVRYVDLPGCRVHDSKFDPSIYDSSRKVYESSDLLNQDLTPVYIGGHLWYLGHNGITRVRIGSLANYSSVDSSRYRRGWVLDASIPSVHYYGYSEGGGYAKNTYISRDRLHTLTSSIPLPFSVFSSPYFATWNNEYTYLWDNSRNFYLWDHMNSYKSKLYQIADIPYGNFRSLTDVRSPFYIVYGMNSNQELSFHVFCAEGYEPNRMEVIQ